jgi:hypothetical protein
MENHTENRVRADFITETTQLKTSVRPSASDCQSKKLKSRIPYVSAVRHVRIFTKSDYQLRHVCPSDRKVQLGSHWSDFHEILFLRIFRKSVENFSSFIKI